MTRTLELGFADHCVEIELGDPTIEQWFRDRFVNCLVSGGSPVGRYSIRLDAEKGLAVRGPDQFRWHGAVIEEVAEPLVQHFLERLAVHCSLGLAFHAAGVSLNGQGLILSGVSGSGKSTLASACLKRRFDYLSDEVICVDPERLKMTGFSRPLNLKSGSADLVESWVRPAGRVDSMSKGIRWIDPAALGSGEVVPEATLRAIVFPKYVRDASFEEVRLSRGRALTRLMGLYVNRGQLPDSGFRMAAQLARRLTCWEIRFSQAEEAAARLETVLMDTSEECSDRSP